MNCFFYEIKHYRPEQGRLATTFLSNVESGRVLVGSHCQYFSQSYSTAIEGGQGRHFSVRVDINIINIKKGPVSNSLVAGVGGGGGGGGGT